MKVNWNYPTTLWVGDKRINDLTTAETDIEEHINLIEKENKISEKSLRLQELQNWLNYINAN